MNGHAVTLEDVAVYAVGGLPAAEAAAVRAHLATCAECRTEYEHLAPAVNALALSAEGCTDPSRGAVPSGALKSRIMHQVRQETLAGPARNVVSIRAVRPIVWPAYLVGAACLLIALVASVINVSLSGQVKQAQSEVAALSARTASISHSYANERIAMADLLSAQTQRYPVSGGEILRHGNRVYIAMNTLPLPSKGKVYQAWTLRKGATKVAPSVTFTPARSGEVIVPLPQNGTQIDAVAVSVEPEGGSRQPTSTPIFFVKLD